MTEQLPLPSSTAAIAISPHEAHTVPALIAARRSPASAPNGHGQQRNKELSI
jgi:hypothetical protein